MFPLKMIEKLDISSLLQNVESSPCNKMAGEWHGTQDRLVMLLKDHLAVGWSEGANIFSLKSTLEIFVCFLTDESSSVKSIPVYNYPLLCLIHWDDHRHAAFYPPLDGTTDTDKPFRFMKKKILQFVKKAQEDPGQYWEETEHF